jgi:hypothetical protein
LLQHPRRASATLALLIALAWTGPAPSRAAQGDCGQPMTDGSAPTSSDCLVMLRVSIGLGACDPPCICDVNATATVTAADALLCLKKAVGQDLELLCLCAGQSTTTSGPTSTSTLHSTTTTGPGTSTTIPTGSTTTLLDDRCPSVLDLHLLAGVRGHCATNDDCSEGTCDDSLGRCVTATQLDIGWAGNAHDVDVHDSARLVASLACSGSPPTCGDCAIGDLDPSAHNCRCANDNRRTCNEPFAADLDDCEGEVCNCYFGPPLPLTVGGSPLCLVNRMTRNVSGAFDPDTGDLSFDLDLRSLVLTGEQTIAPCPTCGGRCLAPPARLDVPCNKSSDCNTEDEAGTCGQFDEIAGDGERNGLCVGGPDAGFGCDIDGFNTTYPVPGGSGYSLDCFPPSEQNVGGEGLIIQLHESTAAQSLESAVDCGFPPVSARLCPCGICGDVASAPCSSNADCEPPATCAALSGSALPNACDDEVCTVGDDGEGACLGGPFDRFCDQILRANGGGLVPCQSNADCEPAAIGIAAGACTVETPRPCFGATVAVAGAADPRSPSAAAVTCVPPLSGESLNSAIGLPGPMRLKTDISAKTFCDQDLSSLYVPGQGCK